MWFERREVLKKFYALISFSAILLLTDVLIGERFMVISPKIYILFAINYVLLSILIFIITSLIMKLFLKKKYYSVHDFYYIYFIVALIIFDFVIINWKFLGGFDFFDLKGFFSKLFSVKTIFVNLIFAVGIFLFIKTLKRYFVKTLQSFNLSFFLSFTILTFSLTQFLNFYVFRWPELPSSFFQIACCLGFILIVPFISLWLIALLNRVLRLQITVKKVLQPLVLALFVVSITFIFKEATLSFFYVKNNANQTIEQDGKKITNIFLIVLDTARRDHFSCYGYERETTPNIDKFASESVLFTNFYNVAPWTLPSHASLFTGLYSSSHGAHHLNELICAPLSENHLTLAEILKANGYNTAAFSSNGIVSRNNNFDQGFDVFYHEKGSMFNFFWGMILRTNEFLQRKMLHNKRLGINKYKLSSELNSMIVNYLERRKQEANFLFINYMEPHYGCYYLPGKFNNLYDFSMEKFRLFDQSEIARGRKELDEEDRQIALDWLDCRMRYVDYNFGKFIAKLKELGIYDNSLIILLSDHGDLFGEHNSFGHSRDLYNELIYSPLIIKYPKEMKRSGKFDGFVQTVDIMPEILNLLGYECPDYIQGQPFEQVDHEIVAEVFKNKKSAELYPERYYRDLRTIIATAPRVYKYFKSSRNINELYDLENDPFELNNILNEKKDIAQELDERLNNWVQQIKPLFDEKDRPKKLDKTLEERLRALGYIK